VIQLALVRVAQTGDVPEGTGSIVQAGAHALALFNLGGTFYAIDNTCTHRGGPLGQGKVEGTTVTCPWHGSEFDIITGRVVKGPANRPVATYPVQVTGQDVLVEI
jgi:nitrite reductase (NADH) small subunit